MPWRYAEPPYTSMPSYRMTGIRFAIGGIGAGGGAGRQRRWPLHRSISRHSGHPVTSPSTTPPADEYHAASDGQQHDQSADRDAPVADRPCWFCRPPCWPCGTSVLSSSDSLGSVGSASLGSVGLPGSVGSVGPSLAFTVTVLSAVACCRPCLRQHVLSPLRRVHRAGHLDGIGHVTIHIVRGRHAGQRLEFGILFHRHVIHAGEHRRGHVGGRNRLLLIQRSIKTSNDTPLYQNMSTRKTEEHHLPRNDVARERRRRGTPPPSAATRPECAAQPPYAVVTNRAIPPIRNNRPRNCATTPGVSRQIRPDAHHGSTQDPWPKHPSTTPAGLRPTAPARPPSCRLSARDTPGKSPIQGQ